MPELPEVETVRVALDRAWKGRIIKDLRILRRDLRRSLPAGYEDLLTGRAVLKTMRRGKYIVVFMTDGAGFGLHLGMSGQILIGRYGADIPEGKHDQAVFSLQGGQDVVFRDPRRFGMMFPLSERKWANTPPFDSMGPEPLEEAFSGSVLQERLQRRKSNIKGALLDQNVVAGVGNIYACEALFRSAISPLRPSDTINAKEAESLAVAIQDVLRAAIESGGSSLKDFVQTNGTPGYFQHRFDVYGREGEICTGCMPQGRESRIERIVQAGRSTFFCPHCQN